MTNREMEHIYVLPEDDANRQIVNGFYTHPRVNRSRMKVSPPSGGWLKVLQSFEDTQVANLRTYPQRFLVLIIDFDGDATRLAKAQSFIPEDLRNRVFVLGTRTNPENLRRSIRPRHSFERLGRALADDCVTDTAETWGQQELICNLVEVQRMRATVHQWLFS